MTTGLLRWSRADRRVRSSGNRCRFVLVVGVFAVVGLAARQMEAQTCAAITAAEWDVWGNLIDFRPPQSVLDTAQATQWAWQSIDSGVGPLNLDRYEVEITRMPIGDGGVLTSENLLEDVRTRLPYFLYPVRQLWGELPPRTEFGAVDDFNLGLWNKGTVGSQMVFGMRPPAMPLTLSAAGVVVPAHVLLAERSNHHWRFVTGNKQSPPHPVSGVREFGFKIEGNKTILYTRGADRISGLMYQAGNDVIFGGGENLWASFQQNVAGFVNGRGGEARIRNPYSTRHCWQHVQQYRGRITPPSGLSIRSGE